MADLSTKKKKELAEILYTRNNISQKEVAARVGVSEVTMSRWVNEHDKAWDKMRLAVTKTVDENISRISMQLDELNHTISQRAKGERYPTSKEADIIGKLTAAIKKMKNEVDVEDIVNVSIKFLNWLRKFDLPKAQELSDLFDAFIKDNIK
jgi:transcriptional regulator with XRE-family HTH domain